MFMLERRRNRRFRVLYMPFGRFWKRYVLGHAPVPTPPIGSQETKADGDVARTIPECLLHGPEALRRRGSRLR